MAISSSHLQNRFTELWVLGMLAEWEGKGRVIRVLIRTLVCIQYNTACKKCMELLSVGCF